MKLLKIFAVGAMLLFGAVAANAQPGGPGGPGGPPPGDFNPEEMIKMRADRMKEDLKLNDDQYQKVLAIYKAEHEEMMKMMQEGPQEPDMEAFQKRRDAQKAEFKKILTKEQFKQYEEMEAQRGPGGPGGPGPGPGGPGPRQ